MLSPKRQNFAPCQSCHAAAARVQTPICDCTAESCQWPTTTLRFNLMRLMINPCSRSPCADWFKFMKSMSIVAQGMSRLCCVCRWSSGRRNSFRPLIHILDGENVWHQVIKPMQRELTLACWQRAVASAALLMTGLKTTSTGMREEALRAAATCWALSGHLFEGVRAVEMLAAGDEPDLELFQVEHERRVSRRPKRVKSKGDPFPFSKGCQNIIEFLR